MKKGIVVVILLLRVVELISRETPATEAFVNPNSGTKIELKNQKKRRVQAAPRDEETPRKSTLSYQEDLEVKEQQEQIWYDKVWRLERELKQVEDRTSLANQGRISARTSSQGYRGARELASSELTSLERSVSELEATLKATMRDVQQAEAKFAALNRQRIALEANEAAANQLILETKQKTERLKKQNQALKATIEPAAKNAFKKQGEAAEARRDAIGLRVLLERHDGEKRLEVLRSQINRWWQKAINPSVAKIEPESVFLMTQLMAAGAWGEALARRDRAVAQASVQAAAEALEASKNNLKLETQLTEFASSIQNALSKVLKTETQALQHSARQVLRYKRKNKNKKLIAPHIHSSFQKKDKISKELKPLVPAALIAIVAPPAAVLVGVVTAAIWKLWPTTNFPTLSISTPVNTPPKEPFNPTPPTDLSGLPPPPPPPILPPGGGGGGGGDGHYGNSLSDWRVLPPARHKPLIGSVSSDSKKKSGYPASTSKFYGSWYNLHQEPLRLPRSKKKKIAAGQGLTQGMWAKAVGTIIALASTSNPQNSFMIVDFGANYIDLAAAIATMHRHDIRLALVRDGPAARYHEGRRRLEPLFTFEQNFSQPLVMVNEPADVARYADKKLVVLLTGDRVKDFPNALLETPKALVLDLPGIPTTNWSFVLDLGSYFQHTYFTLPTAALLDSETAKMTKKIGPDRLLWASAPAVTLDDEPRYARNLRAAAKRIDTLFPDDPRAQFKILGKNALTLFPTLLLGESSS